MKKSRVPKSSFRNWLSCGKGHLQDFPSDLFAYIDPIPTSTDECWRWIGGRGGGKTPTAWYEGRNVGVKRLLCLGYNLKLQIRRGVGQHCHNDSCVNPWHYDPVFRGKYNCHICGGKTWVNHRTTTGKKNLFCPSCKRKFIAHDSDVIPGYQSSYRSISRGLTQKEKNNFMSTYWELFREEQNEKWQKRKKYEDLLRHAWVNRITDARSQGLSPEDFLLLKEELERRRSL